MPGWSAISPWAACPRSDPTSRPVSSAGLATESLRAYVLATAKPAQAVTPAPYYLRMALDDKPGALAKVATVLGKAGVSIDRMRQYGHTDPNAPVLIVSHKTPRDVVFVDELPRTATGKIRYNRLVSHGGSAVRRPEYPAART